ncbi:MAG: Asp-tRNA(Asn)/Glu-tRNA(Gln) amidotransferase subunit GatB [Anaerolineaceae bacterium]|nr:Asp-tRNA(Asn)/Glu-tRNA(Gln) amidotransferase subunit GatB [Anaerolineaceae bacterium]
MEFEPVIGLEVHAELQTRSKMFCSCPVVDNTLSDSNSAVCPVCSGMPGVLPVVNEQAVEYGMKVALALNCKIANTSIFERKNYFYPDLPKGFQISQYEQPLAVNGFLYIQTSLGEKKIRINRVHLEEDTGKLTHISEEENYSLVDLNRAGVPLLEIVTEPDMHTVEEVHAYATGLRMIIRYLGVNSGDMEKGVMRFEANVSVKKVNTEKLGTRVEIKNLNSFRAMERAIEYEVQRQIAVLESGGRVHQETLGWNEDLGETYSQRSKEEAHDYRYFPEPDLPPLIVTQDWIERVESSLPELPYQRLRRYQQDFYLSPVNAMRLIDDQNVADYFEQCAAVDEQISPLKIANWIATELFTWMRQSKAPISEIRVSPEEMVALLKFIENKSINLNTAKKVFAEMLKSGKSADTIIKSKGMGQISDLNAIEEMVNKVLNDHPGELQAYKAGKETLENWFFGQVMRSAKGQANPSLVKAELGRQLLSRMKKTG